MGSWSFVFRALAVAVLLSAPLNARGDEGSEPEDFVPEFTCPESLTRLPSKKKTRTDLWAGASVAAGTLLLGSFGWVYYQSLPENEAAVAPPAVETTAEESPSTPLLDVLQAALQRSDELDAEAAQVLQATEVKP